MKKSLLYLVIICNIFILNINICTLNAQWVSIGPEGGYINCMTKSGNTLYAVTGFYFTISQLYKSTDEGQSWEKINSPTFPIADVFAIASVGNSLFISSDGIYRSDDNGLTWVKKYNMGAALLTANSTTVYAAIQYSGILQSSDNGEHWTLSNNGLTDLWFYSMTANETSVFVGTGDQNEGVFRSTDNGATWHQVNNGLAYYYDGNWIPNMAPMISSLAFVGNDLYAGTEESQGIWKSINNGNNWVFTSMETMNYIAITAITGDESVVIAGSRNGGGLLKSNDGGTTWSEANTGIDNYGIVTTLTMDGGNTYVGTKGGIYKSADDGNSWSMSSGGIRTQNITYPGFALLGNDLFIGSGYGGIFHSADEGATWNDVNGGLPISEWNLDNLYSTSTALFAWDRVSFDGGTTWGMSNDYSPGSAFFGYDGPRWLEHGNAWFAIKSYDYAGVYRSTDNGQNWTTINNGIPNPESTAFFSIHSKGTTLFLGTSTGFYYSDDNGDSWLKGSFPDINQWTLLGASFISTGTADVCGLIGGGGSRGIYRSSDNGATWTRVSDLLTHKFVSAGNTIFASGTNLELVQGDMVEVPRVFKSQDDGQSWTNASGSLSNISVISLASDGSSIFVSKYLPGNNAIYISKDEGNSWIEISDGLPPTIYTSSFFINNEKIYAGTNTASVWVRNLSEFVAPLQPDAITGVVSPCAGSVETFGVTSVPGVSYTWQVPQDWSIISGNGTNSITVNVGNTSGLVLVIPSNNFGSGPSQYLLVNPVSAVNVMALIEADQSSVCEGDALTFTSVIENGGSQPVYNWLVNGTATGDNAATFSYIPLHNDIVSMVFTSSISCTVENPITSNSIAVMVNAIPEVSWSGLSDSICLNHLPITLSGGLPAGGTYSGTGITGNIFDPASAGAGEHVLSYTYSDENNCTNSATTILKVNACLGLEELGAIVSIFPNPASDKINITLPDQQIIDEIVIFNMMGIKVLENYSINAHGSVTLSLHGIPSGNYFIRITTRNGTIAKTIIIEK